MLRLSLVSILFTGFLVGCGTKSTVVLRPNPDGSVGEIEVSNEIGSRRLTEPNHATEAKTNSEPSQPKIMSDAEIKQKFTEVLEIQPNPPVRFILYFQFDSSKLTSESEDTLPDIVAAIMKSESPEIIISGHTDRSGDKKYNIRLSLKRAKNIRDRLIAIGVSKDIMDVSSHGEGNPLVKTADNVSEPRNRRVEITIK